MSVVDQSTLAAGKVATGFSFPAVALYANTAGVSSYTSGRRLARGVDVSLNVDTADDNRFSADNRTAETQEGIFQSGTADLTVDGLLIAARQLIMGLPAAREVAVGEGAGALTFNLYDHGDSQKIPYVGLGYVTRYMSNGITTYVPTILWKVRFNQLSTTAATQDGAEIDWQTQALTAVISRDDTAAHNWLSEGDDYTTEAEAWAVIAAIFGIEDDAA